MKIEIHIDCSDGLTFRRPSLVKPQFADECDLSKIVQRFMRTGELPNLQVKKPLNVDGTSLPESFDEMMNMKVNLSNDFENEPDAIKEACQHNLEIYGEFKCLDGAEQVKFLQSKGWSKDQIISFLKCSDLFELPQEQKTPPQEQKTPPQEQQ